YVCTRRRRRRWFFIRIRHHLGRWLCLWHLVSLSRGPGRFLDRAGHVCAVGGDDENRGAERFQRLDEVLGHRPDHAARGIWHLSLVVCHGNQYLDHHFGAPFSGAERQSTTSGTPGQPTDVETPVVAVYRWRAGWVDRRACLASVGSHRTQ